MSYNRLDRRGKRGYSPRVMNLKRTMLMAGMLFLPAMTSQAVEVILSGGVALRGWEVLRGPEAHDRWWANFIRAATIRIEHIRKENPQAKIKWIVFRPAYVARGKEDKKDYVSMIKETAGKKKVQLIYVDTAEQTYKAINAAGAGRDKITSFYYFGHSNAHAFMLDYSSDIMAASTHWMHEKDLAERLNPKAFAPNANCWSYGCYTGNSMSQVWQKSLGVPLWGNTRYTRYQPVGWGELPEGSGSWVK